MAQPDRPPIRTPDQRLRVFVSSTMRELAEERRAAREAIAHLRLSPILFEIGARPYAPQDLYRAYLEQSDIFIGLYGREYGWVAPGAEISGLEDEYRLARDKPKLLYIKSAPDRDARLTKMLDEIAGEGELSYKRFATPKELRGLIENDLALMLSERFQAAAETAEQRPSAGRRALPRFPTRLIGREGEVSRVAELLAEEHVRLVTLTGPGGCGKTRLAVEAAHSLAPAFEDVLFVPLASVSDPSLVLPAIADALGLHDAGERPLIDAVRDGLAGRSTLLLLDNFEQVLEGATAISELLAALPDLKLLVTSRESLAVYGEHELPVPPLAVAPEPSPAPATLSTAAELFVDRARAVRPELELGGENAGVVEDICSRLDGLPLAIELAAARTRVLPPDAILERLSGHLDFLAGGPRDLPQRQRTMRSTIAWSYELLDAPEQRLFERASVFASGFSLEAVETVCDPDGDLSADALDLLASLVAKNLLRAVDPLAGQPRFEMLGLIRAFGLERLAESGELEELRDRHWRYYLPFHGRDWSRFVGPNADEERRRLGLHHSDVREAYEWATERLARGDAALADAVEAGIALAFFWYITGRLSEGRELTDRAVERTATSGNRPARAGSLEANGLVAMWQGDLRTARRHLEDALAIWRRYGDGTGPARAAMLLGITAVNQGDAEAALPLLGEAERAFRASGDDADVAVCLMHAGNVSLQQGRLVEARETFDRGLAIARRLQADWLIASLLNNLGETARCRGDHASARHHYAEALAIFEEQPVPGDAARCRHSLAYVALRQGRVDEARAAFLEALRRFRDLGNQRGVAESLQGIAGVFAAAGEPERAAEVLGASRRSLEEIEAALWPSDRAELESDLEAIRRALGEDTERLIAEGRKTPIDEVLAGVLEGSPQ